ncbi:HlyD family type I secretion periplasmic adaptor subunit [Methylobacterium aquaticum]|uniref:HlyD family type I secretion periplasmic adaptor subunit n=1 Tax=Methylobacterium aquaticum TaxID=270351 RepID=UPI0019317ED3|nr:HlyD family type I secretion periplasmic adaptor subunit [Methylobacterium aquaticum]QRE77316.1 HlyD family type I secretion periplasmic adaptor subunit [Methylobacterium aquaticum]
MSPITPDTQASIRRHLLAGAIGGALLFVGAGGWAATAEFSGAVVTAGSLVVESDVKKVQHPTGGVVGELRVKNGDRVAAGDVLLRLDETVVQANLAIVTRSIDESTARRARLEAERDGASDLAVPAELTARSADPVVASLINGERRLFQTRASAREGQKSQLAERVGQLDEQIRGLDEQIAAKAREITLIERELGGVRDLWEKKLVPIQRVSALERDLARLEGEKGTLVSTIAQVRGRITETRLQILQIDQDLRTEVGKELAEIRSKVSEYAERRIAAEDQLRRVEIRAPQDGLVHQLAVHTVGGVVAPGAEIMQIVPTADHLAVEAKLAPQDIDQVHVGQAASLRFSAFNQRTTPVVMGTVSRISPDLTTDPRTGQGTYTTRVAVSDAEMKRLGTVRLTPGMPVEAFIQTESRTVLSFFTKPLTDQVARAFREK